MFDQDILQNIPPALYSVVCGTGGLLLIAWSYILYRRSKRKNQAEKPQQKTKTPSGPGLGAAIKNFFFYPEEEKSERQASTMTQKTNPAVPPSRSYSVPIPEGPPGAAEVMRVWRDVADGALIIQIDGAFYRTMPDIISAGQDRRFMNALRELARLAKETQPAPPPAPQPQLSVEEPEPEPLQEAAPAHTAEPVLTASEDPAPQPQDQTEAVPVQPTVEQNVLPPLPPLKRPSAFEEAESEPIGSFFANVKKVVTRRGTQEEALPPELILSIPEQIEEHLQRKLLSQPNWRSRSIHVRAAPDGSVRIEVDGKFYEGVSDIQESDVRDFVIAAIQDWEAKS